ncbi:MAG: hypothetical protein R3324_07085, partial [Halobacteriales archaeon]|nr:hypothetical protein [Halobacteriales archaeon]
MNLDELRSVQVEERKTDSLQPLRESFYSDVAEFIAGLREERERAAAGVEDPFASTEVRELSDEIETAEEVVQAIYERRVGKVVKRASLAAAGIPTDEEGLTAEETALFETLVAEIEANRRTVLDILGGADTDAPDGTSSPAVEASDPEPDPTAEAGDGPTDELAAPEPPPEESVFDAGDAVGGSDSSGGSSTKATQPGADDDMTASEQSSTAVEP